MPLSREQILEADDLGLEEVEVPEWGGTVLIRPMSGADRDAFEASLFTRRPITEGPNKGALETVPDAANATAKFVSKVIVDENGDLLFSKSDIIALGKKNANALARVYEKAAEMSALDKDSVAEAEGNSDAAPSGASTSSEPTQQESQ